MRELFRAWKRKVGIVTLAFACALVAGWVRSVETADVVSFPMGYPSIPGFISGKNVIRCWSGEDSDWREIDRWTFPEWQQGSVRTRFKEHEWLKIGTNSGGFGYEITKDSTIVVVPYWSIVLPLTLLSAYLLLSKPPIAQDSPAS